MAFLKRLKRPLRAAFSKKQQQQQQNNAKTPPAKQAPVQAAASPTSIEKQAPPPQAVERTATPVSVACTATTTSSSSGGSSTRSFEPEEQRQHQHEESVPFIITQTSRTIPLSPLVADREEAEPVLDIENQVSNLSIDNLDAGGDDHDHDDDIDINDNIQQRQSSARQLSYAAPSQSPSGATATSEQPTEEAPTLKVFPSTPLPDLHYSSSHGQQQQQLLDTSTTTNKARPTIPTEVIVINEIATLATGQQPSDNNQDLILQLQTAQIENECHKARIQEMEELVESYQTYLDKTQTICETVLQERDTMSQELQRHERSTQLLTFMKGCMVFALVLQYLYPSVLSIAVIVYLMMDLTVMG